MGGEGEGVCVCVFFFNDTATTEIYTLSLHDALPISIRLCFNLHVSFGKPLNRVTWLPAVEGTQKLSIAAWIVAYEVSWFEAVMGDIASPSTGDFDLGQGAASGFINSDFGLGIGLCRSQGCKEAGSSTADNSYDLWGLFGHFLFRAKAEDCS